LVYEVAYLNESSSCILVFLMPITYDYIPRFLQHVSSTQDSSVLWRT
jgi:hypothetical protein